ncbi:hypothetical protein [Lactococcus petauri]|uniref:hypothetical protein n=1 Tax=Lactococcus petauri TaxID=1940789 RepID=UPI0030CB58F1
MKSSWKNQRLATGRLEKYYTERFNKAFDNWSNLYDSMIQLNDDFQRASEDLKHCHRKLKEAKEKK